MGLKEWVRSRSKSRSRTSADIKRSFSGANEPTITPTIPAVPPTLSSDLGQRTPKQSADFSSSQYRTPPSLTTADRNYESPASSESYTYPLRGSSQSGAVLGSVGQRHFSSDSTPGTAVSSDEAEPASILNRGRSVRASNGSAPYRYAGMNDHTSAPIGTSQMSMNADDPSSQKAPIPAGHTLRHQADVSDLSKEMSSHSQLDSYAEDRNALPNTDKPLPAPSDDARGSISSLTPMQHSGAVDGSNSNGFTQKTAAISSTHDSNAETASSLNNGSSSAGAAYAQYNHDDLTPFATPAFERSHDAVQPFSQAEVKSGTQTAYHPSTKMAISGASKPPNLRGIVDLTNTEDTTVEVRTAPTVVHEHIMPSVHHIRHEVVTREFHTHHYYHRILPVIEVEVLPARHYIHSKTHPGHLEEIPAEMLPQSTIDRYNNKHWVIAETVSKPNDTPLPGRRRFTAKEFAPGEGDYKEWIGEDGVPRTETTWIYPPVFNEVLYKEGLTQPVDIL